MKLREMSKEKSVTLQCVSHAKTHIIKSEYKTKLFVRSVPNGHPPLPRCSWSQGVTRSNTCPLAGHMTRYTMTSAP